MGQLTVTSRWVPQQTGQISPPTPGQKRRGRRVSQMAQAIASSIEGGGVMSRTNLFFKVEIEHDPEEKPERIGDEICRKILKLYGVREAELSNYTTAEE
jgi:hypothetical protein